jgi:hypothetical protein
MGCMLGLGKVVRCTIAMLKFSRVVCGTTTPLTPCEPSRVTTPISHSSEQGTLPTTSLISKQVVLYRTRDGTCYPGVSTPKTRSLADSNMTNHKPWRSQPSPPFQTLLKPQHRTSQRSPHITTDGRLTLSALNTSQTQHHKDGWAGPSALASWPERSTRGRRPAGPGPGFDSIWPRKLENPLYIFKLFCKLQTNLNSNQIWISMTYSHTIKYKSTSSPRKICHNMNATNIIIYV